MKNIYNKIGGGISTVPKSMYGCCNWGGLPGEYLVSTDISKLVWIKLDVDGGNSNYIYETICIKVSNDLFNDEYE